MATATGGGAGGDDRAADAALALQRLLAVQRVQRMYPANNPNVRASARKLCEVLVRFPHGAPLELEVERERISFAGWPLGQDQADVVALANRLYLANVVVLTFEADANEEEILGLLQGLKASEDGAIGFGQFEAWLRDHGVARIHVREAGRVAIELALGSGQGSAWDAASLQRLNELEQEVFGGKHAGFRQTFRGVVEGEDAKAARLTGLLAQPAEFARLLVEVASHERKDGKIDLDRQFAVTLKLVSELGPMIDNVAAEDRLDLYAKLTELCEILERTLRREITDVSVAPYARIGPVLRLFPDKIRHMTVKEALGLGLGSGLMPLLLGALRRVARGDEVLPAFLAGGEPPPPRPYEVRFDAYQPVPLAAAPPVPPRLGPQFFEARPGDRPHPGETALANAIRSANGIVDSIAILRDLLAVESDAEAYRKLLAALVTRFRLCLASKTLGFAREVLQALEAERVRNALPEIGDAELLGPTVEAIAACGAPDAMAAFVEAIEPLPPGSPEMEQASELCRLIGGPAVSSLLDILAEEDQRPVRRKLLDILLKAGPEHFGRFVALRDDDRWYVARNVAWLLGQFGPAALPHLAPLAAHPEPRVRREVLRAAVQNPSAEATELLLALAADPEDTILREALARLLSQGERRAAPALNALLARSDFGQRDRETVEEVVRAVGALGDAASLELLDGLATGRDAKGWLRTNDLRQLLLTEAHQLRASLGQGGGRR